MVPVDQSVSQKQIRIKMKSKSLSKLKDNKIDKAKSKKIYIN